MKTLNAQQMQTHVPIVGVLLIVGHSLYLVGAIIVFVVMAVVSGMMGSIGIASGDPEAARILPQISGWLALLGIGLALFFGALSLPGIIAGIGLLARKPWARILGIVVAILGLLHFPVGTLIGAYAILVLLQDAAPGYFETPAARLDTQLQPA